MSFLKVGGDHASKIEKAAAAGNRELMQDDLPPETMILTGIKRRQGFLIQQLRRRYDYFQYFFGVLGPRGHSRHY
jgi:hypothetical protein